MTTQSDAIGAACGIAQKQASEVVIHRPDGCTLDKDSYGNDTYPHQDTRHCDPKPSRKIKARCWSPVFKFSLIQVTEMRSVSFPR
ncbi:DUF2188 domain-containing protein [Desulfosarcina ovata]|uniref:DUF2188 domain-containing protein n=1 Tax=Desulfosarcina ovata TaxID=83564 RepID=UPI0012D37177|nr:DUF2188 domain-containing protein [Desulfosarcina ovata]